MPSLAKIIETVGKPMPAVIPPRAHAVADYTMAGLFVAGGILFWRRKKRVALAAFLCGAAQAGVILLSDTPGGVKPVIPPGLHAKIDFGLASLAASMPGTFAFQHERERGFFRLQSAAMATVATLSERGRRPTLVKKQRSNE